MIPFFKSGARYLIALGASYDFCIPLMRIELTFLSVLKNSYQS